MPPQLETPASRTPPGWHSETPSSRMAGLAQQLADDLKDLPKDSPALGTLSELTSLISGLDGYLSSVSNKAPKAVTEVIDSANAVDWTAVHARGDTQYRLIKEMSAGPFEAVVLQQLARMTGAKRCLEVGMFAGSTTLALALLPQIERVTTLELEPYLLRCAEPFWSKAGVRGKIDARIGDAVTSLSALAREQARYDLIFIDCHKDGYQAVFDASVKLLSKSGNVIVDNVLFKGTPWVPDERFAKPSKCIRDFNETIRKDKRFDVVVLPVRDGISLIRWKEGKA